jgi:hypothetical protein
MAWLKRESVYDRRIRELEEEADRVRKSMQQLMKNAPVEAVSGRSARPTQTDKPSPGLPPRTPRIRSSVDFRKKQLEADAEPVAESDTMNEVASQTVKPAPSRKAPDPEQFASYLASGSFGKPRSLTRERRLQRNKAIMMLIFALLAVYSLYMWMK